MFNFIKDLVWNTLKKFQKDNCPQLAASITYYVIFSLFPLLIFLTGIAGMLLDEGARRDVVNEVLKIIPLNEGEGRNSVEDAVRALSGDNARALGLAGLVGSLWSSSSMFGAIRRALNIVYRDPEYSRPWAQQKVVDLALVLGLGLLFALSVSATTALTIIRERSDDLAWLGDAREDLGFVFTLGEYAIPFVISFIAFTFCYTVVPSRNRNLGNAWPGALAAALLFEVAKNGFSFYVTHFRNFDLVFGSLGAVATFMFWVFISSQIMLLGAEVATIYPMVREKKIKQPKFSGMGALPLYVKAFRTVKKLFVAEPVKERPETK